MTSRTGDLDADADSLMCRQLGLTYNDDRPKMRPRTGLAEPFGQVGIENDQIGWDWDDDDDDDREVCIDIQAPLSEFGDFGDFLRTMLCLSESHRELQSRIRSCFLQILLM